MRPFPQTNEVRYAGKAGFGRHIRDGSIGAFQQMTRELQALRLQIIARRLAGVFAERAPELRWTETDGARKFADGKLRVFRIKSSVFCNHNGAWKYRARSKSSIAHSFQATPKTASGLECVVAIGEVYAATLRFRDAPRDDSRSFVRHLRFKRGHRLMHQFRFVAFSEMRLPAVATQQLFQFLAGNARQKSGIGNLVAVEMQNRQHRAIGGGVEEFVGMPRRCQGVGFGFGFAIADHARHNEIGIIENRAERMTERVAQFAAFVNRAGRFGRDVAGMPPGNENCKNSLRNPASSRLISG